MKKMFNNLFSEKYLLRKDGPEGLSSGAESEPGAVRLEFRTGKTLDKSGKVLESAHEFLVWNKSIDEEFKRKSGNLYLIDGHSPERSYHLFEKMIHCTEFVTYKGYSPNEGDYAIQIVSQPLMDNGHPSNPTASPESRIRQAARFTNGKWVKMVHGFQKNIVYDLRRGAEDGKPLRWRCMDQYDRWHWNDKQRAEANLVVAAGLVCPDPAAPVDYEKPRPGPWCEGVTKADKEREYERGGIPFMPNPHRLNDDTPDAGEER